MSECFQKFGTTEEQDKAREEWFATREDRKRQNREEEVKRKQEYTFNKEWWERYEKERKEKERLETITK